MTVGSWISYGDTVRVREGDPPRHSWSADATVVVPDSFKGEGTPNNSWRLVEFDGGVRLLIHVDRLWKVGRPEPVYSKGGAL
jgi:hypothetical protein